MKISEVSKLYNIESHTLRYYEKEGFLGNVIKNESNQRDYNTGNLIRLDMVIKLRNAGMNIAAIKEYIELSNQGNETVLERRDLLELRMKKLEKQIQEMQNSKLFLEEKIGVYNKILEKK